VLVRIKASGVNPLDLKNRAGQAAHARHPLPVILGSDLARVVETIGSDVSAFRQGDEGVCTENLNPETVVMKSAQDGKRPDHTGPRTGRETGASLSKAKCVRVSL
jgi:NADPH:quinone reductase-like Zn-dependent oxidoreductase